MRLSIFIAVVILTFGPGAALAEQGRQVAPGVWEVRLDLPGNLTHKLPSVSDGQLSPDKARPIPAQPASATGDKNWVTLLADDFESGFPGTTWELFYDGDGPYWDDWVCTSGTTPPHSAGCAAGGPGAISCGEEYPNLLNTFMTAGPFPLGDSYNSAGILECILNQKSETEFDTFFMLISLNGGDGGTGFEYRGVFTNKTISIDLANVPFLGNVLHEPEIWVSFGFRSNGEIVDVNGAQIDDVLLAVVKSDHPQDPPVLQISALKNPGRPRSLQILVEVTNGSGSFPTVIANGLKVTVVSLGEGIYSGTYSAAQSVTGVTISTTDTNNEGSGASQTSVSFQ
jgi:hypothetical protein